MASIPVLLNRGGGALARDPELPGRVEKALKEAGLDVDVELLSGGDCSVRCHAIAERGAAALADNVRAHMTERVITAHEKTTIESLMRTMTTGRFRHVPVIEEGALCGLVSIGDVVKHRLEEFEAEQQALKEYIATA